jgi:hypothetical protein
VALRAASIDFFVDHGPAVDPLPTTRRGGFSRTTPKLTTLFTWLDGGLILVWILGTPVPCSSAAWVSFWLLVVPRARAAQRAARVAPCRRFGAFVHADSRSPAPGSSWV